MMKIHVNGREVEVEEGTLSYEKIVELAGMSGNPSVIVHAKAALGLELNRSLTPGTTVTLTSDMTRIVANCAHTGNA